MYLPVVFCLQVYASGTGNNRHPLFFLQWMWRGRHDRKRKRRASSDLNLPTIKSPIKQALKPDPLPNNLSASSSASSLLPAFPPPLSPVRVKPGALPLVDASAAAVAAGLEYQEPADVAAERRKVEAMQSYTNHPIVVKHLQKTYPSRDGQPPKVSAVTRFDCKVCVCCLAWRDCRATPIALFEFV
jgi:hypothetical protein